MRCICHSGCWRGLCPLSCWLILSRLVSPCSRSQHKCLCACAVSWDQETDTAERQPSTNCLHAFQMDPFPQLLLVSASQMLLLAGCWSAQWRERATRGAHGNGCDFGSTASLQVPNPKIVNK